MPTKANWIDLIPTSSDAYIYQADLICEDCGNKIIEQLEKKGVEDTGDSDDFPQGPHSDGGGESDSPQHCGIGSGCVNKIHIPGGATIGMPLGNPLTSDGVKYLRDSVANDIIATDAHHRKVGRLWARIYSDCLRDCPLIELSQSALLVNYKQVTGITIASPLIKILRLLKKKENAVIVPEIFTDCSCIYGGATTSEKTILWRVETMDDGGYKDPETVYLPPSEAHERTLQDMIEEAISEGAWN